MSTSIPTPPTIHTPPTSGGSGTIADGDYGDITVSGGGTVMTVDSGAIAYSELSGVPSTFAPSAHAANHKSAGSDPIKLDELKAPDDNTTLNASTSVHGLLRKLDNTATNFLDGQGNWDSVKDSDLSTSDITTNDVSASKHGFAPKAPNDATKFLDGTGAYSVPAGTGATASQVSEAKRDPIYKRFTLGGSDAEFTGSDLAGFTLVNSGSHNPTNTEDNDVLSVAHPGGDASAELHAYMKAVTVNANNFVEAWIKFHIRSNNGPSVGVIMANGNTYGAGAQVGCWFFSPSSGNISLSLAGFTNYNTAGTTTNTAVGQVITTDLGIRLQYLGSNNWAGFMSLDGVSWYNVTGTLSRTMTPTHVGFVCSTWGSAAPHLFTFRYFRFG